GGVDTEQAARYVPRRLQSRRHRHVNAVIVVRRQVERREGAAREAVCPLEARWRKQRVEPVVAALRLQERELVEVADLAHGAIDGREDRLRPALDRASAGSQRAGEEFIEARIRERVRLRGLLQPRAVASNEGANQR